MAEEFETILIVDDDRQVRRTLSETLGAWNYRTLQAESIAEARAVFAADEPGMVLLDIDLPDGSGLDFLTTIKHQNSETIVVMITGSVDVKSTLAALRGGAHDFIGKPIRLEELRVTLRNGKETRQLRRELRRARRERSEGIGFNQIIGESPAIKTALNLARKVAESDVRSVLLQGETGTGKDLFAQAIHHGSDRRDAPYSAINCAALPANLIESELFGHEKGSFTDAKARKEGLFEQANRGTLFLDEISEMEPALQAKLLRVLEEGVFRRVGGLREIPLDVRVIAASNRDLKKDSAEGKFRLDLFYRLSVILIEIPPLRARGDDVLLLANHYIEKTNVKRRGNKTLRGLSPETTEIFRNHEWTGNVRELRNVIERASILEEGDLISTEYLPIDLTTNKSNQAGKTGSFLFALPMAGIPLETVELDLARQAMARTGGNLTQAAKLLGVSRDQLRYRLKKPVKVEIPK